MRAYCVYSAYIIAFQGILDKNFRNDLLKKIQGDDRIMPVNKVGFLLPDRQKIGAEYI